MRVVLGEEHGLVRRHVAEPVPAVVGVVLDVHGLGDRHLRDVVEVRQVLVGVDGRWVEHRQREVLGVVDTRPPETGGVNQ
jgi:hypothetical protein